MVVSPRTMASNGEKDRSARLLSKEALPKIEVPRSPPPAVPQFAMPKAVSKPVKAPEPVPPPPKLPEPKPAPRAEPRAQTDGRFKDRTLSWFAAGDQLEHQAGDDREEPEP